jgi:X-Pro dipeptidyl-peptidase
VPISAISSWYDYSRMNGSVYFTGEEDGLAQLVDTKPPAVCQAVRDKLATGQDDATGSYNAFWNERNYRTGPVADVRKVHASVFQVQGVNDLNVKPEQFSTWWAGLKQDGVPRKLWIHQYGHVDPFDFRRPVWVDTLHQWFDHWLYKVDNGIMKQPRVDLETGPDVWTTQRDWPAPEARTVTLHPQPDGTLGLAKASHGATGTFGDTNGTALGSGTAESDMVNDPTTASPYRLAYVSQPLPITAHLSGTPAVRLRLKADKPNVNLTALLVDFGTDTRVNYLGDHSGILNLTTRDCWGSSVSYDTGCFLQTKTDTLTSPVNVVARGWMDADHRDSLTNPTPLTAGKYYDIKWQTLPQDYIFKPGHRLALVISGADFDQTTVTPTGAQVTVDLSGSSISIPVVVSDDKAAFAPMQTKATTVWRGPVNVHLPRQPRQFF